MTERRPRSHPRKKDVARGGDHVYRRSKTVSVTSIDVVPWGRVVKNAQPPTSAQSRLNVDPVTQPCDLLRFEVPDMAEISKMVAREEGGGNADLQHHVSLRIASGEPPAPRRTVGGSGEGKRSGKMACCSRTVNYRDPRPGGRALSLPSRRYGRMGREREREKERVHVGIASVYLPPVLLLVLVQVHVGGYTNKLCYC